MKIKNNNSGQSLVELILAIVVIEIGLFSVWSMFLVNYNSEREAQLRILGANLAREGVELIKNTRDSNWLKVMANEKTTDDNPPQPWSWDQDLNPDNYSLDAINKELTPIVDDNKFVQLYLNPDGFYGVSGSISTPYRRAITLRNICCDSTHNVSCDSNESDAYVIKGEVCDDGQIKIGIKVISEVQWNISANLRSFTTELNLYNWQ